MTIRWKNNTFLFLSLLLASTVFSGVGCRGPLEGWGQATWRQESSSYVFEGGVDDAEDQWAPHIEEDRVSLWMSSGNPKCEIYINLSGSVVYLDLVPHPPRYGHLEGRIFDSWREAVDALPGLNSWDMSEGYPSAATLEMLTEDLHQGVKATLKQSSFFGDTPETMVPGLVPLANDLILGLQDLETQIPQGATSAIDAIQEAQIQLAAGLLAAEQTPPTMDPTTLETAQLRADAFMVDASASIPTGIHTWNTTLNKRFLLSSFLSQPCSKDTSGAPDASCLLSHVAVTTCLSQLPSLKTNLETLSAIERLSDGYPTHHSPDFFLPDVSDATSFVALASDPTPLVNQLEHIDSPLHPCEAENMAIVPRGLSPFARLFQTQTCIEPLSTVSFQQWITQTIEGGQELFPYKTPLLSTHLMARARLRAMSHGVYPESPHLALSATYKSKNIDAFNIKTFFTTIHSYEDLDFLGGKDSQWNPAIYPKYSVEPLPTLALRLARSTHQLSSNLTELAGSQFVETRGRLYANGTASENPMKEDLDAMYLRLLGIYAISAQELGMDSLDSLDATEIALLETETPLDEADTWLYDWEKDTSFEKEAYKVEPLGLTLTGDKYVYWITLGVRILRIYARFAQNRYPDVVSVTGECKGTTRVTRSYNIIQPVTKEVQIPLSKFPLTEENLRELAKEHSTPEEMVYALESP